MAGRRVELVNEDWIWQISRFRSGWSRLCYLVFLAIKPTKTNRKYIFLQTLLHSCIRFVKCKCMYWQRSQKGIYEVKTFKLWFHIQFIQFNLKYREKSMDFCRKMEKNKLKENTYKRNNKSCIDLINCLFNTQHLKWLFSLSPILSNYIRTL